MSWLTRAMFARRLASVSSRSEEHTSELQSRSDLVCRLLLEKKKKCVHATSRRSSCSTCLGRQAGGGVEGGILYAHLLARDQGQPVIDRAVASVENFRHYLHV